MVELKSRLDTLVPDGMSAVSIASGPAIALLAEKQKMR